MKKGIFDLIEDVTDDNKDDEYLSTRATVRAYVWIVLVMGILIFIGWLAFFKPKPVVVSDLSPTKVSTSETTLDLYREFVFEEKCPIGVTKQAYSELTRSLMSGDNAGVTNLIYSGKAFIIPAGTRAKIIEYTVTLRRVRILDGDFAGQDGWCAMEHVK